MVTLRRLGLAMAAMFLMGSAGARADYAYAYSIQDVLMNVSAVSSTASITPGASGVTVKGATGAVIQSDDGSIDLIDGRSNGADPKQSFVSTASPANKPAENSYYTTGPVPPNNLPAVPSINFAPKGMVDPSYARGDDLVTSTSLFGAGFRAVNLAETYLTNTSLGDKATTSTGNGSWSIQSDFKVTGTTELRFNFGYSNLLLSSVLGFGSTADGNYHVDISIVDNTTGFTVFQAQPVELNHSVSAPSNGSNQNDFGPFASSGSVQTNNINFLAGHAYHVTISGVEVVNARLVPEPGSIALLMVGGAGAFGMMRRRKAKAQA